MYVPFTTDQSGTCPRGEIVQFAADPELKLSLNSSDNFNSGSAANWTISPLGHVPDWSVVNGTYIYDGAGESESFTGSSAWTDYTVATDFQIASLNDHPGGRRGRGNTTTASC